MPEKNLDQLIWLPEWARYAIAYTWVAVLAWFGGIVNYIRKLQTGEVDRFNITEFIGDMIISAFSGVIAFFICQVAGYNDWLTAAIVGISGHMGSRAIFWLEKALRNYAILHGVPPVKKEK